MNIKISVAILKLVQMGTCRLKQLTFVKPVMILSFYVKRARKQHTCIQQKIFREHEMCRDIQNFYGHEILAVFRHYFFDLFSEQIV